MSEDDYPQILSCGSKAVVFAEETKGSEWSTGRTPTTLEQCTVYPVDVLIFGQFHFQKELRDPRKAQALYDTYTGNIKAEDTEIYAELIEEGYVIKQNGVPICNVAVLTAECRKQFNKFNEELADTLKPMCIEIRENISRIVKATIPEPLKVYTKGYTETWISFYSSVYLHETLYNKGFIILPEKGDKTPLACYIQEH